MLTEIFKTASVHYSFAAMLSFERYSETLPVMLVGLIQVPKLCNGDLL